MEFTHHTASDISRKAADALCTDGLWLACVVAVNNSGERNKRLSMSFVNIGFGNFIHTDKIIAMVTPDSAPAKRMVQKAREEGNLVDATQGRKTKAVIVTEGQLVLSALLPDTIANRSKSRIWEKEESLHET